MPRFATIIVILFFLGGVAYSAESALPSGFLYPIKIYANENVLRLLAVTDKKEAGFETKRVSRRLTEIEKLAETQKLTEPTLRKLQINFDESIAKFKEISQKVAEKSLSDASFVRSEMQSVLEAHDAVLKSIGTEKMLKGLSEDLNKELRKISDERRDSEEKTFEGKGVEAKSSAESELKAAEKEIADVKKLLDSKNGAKTGETADAEEILKTAIAHVAEGKAKFEVPAYADAFALFKRAEREAGSAKLILSSVEK